MALPFNGQPIPAGAVPGAGYIPGIPRLGVPPLRETDAGLGVAYVGGLRHDGATALPSGLAMAATWDEALVRRAGAMIGHEAHAKGFDIMLAGGVNLVRDPRGGRGFEYAGEDPLLAGRTAGAEVAGIQSAHVVATVKHFALNDQETGRHIVVSRIGEAAARESDLLAFEIAIERGRPGAVMCAYNRVQIGVLPARAACDSDFLLDQVLKRDWGFAGWVMSDWGAVGGVDFARHGLDQQSGEQLDGAVYFGKALAQAAATEPAMAARLADMDRRILHSLAAVGVMSDPPSERPLDLAADAGVAEAVEQAAIVLLRNERGALPLPAGVRRIAVIGGHANVGVLSGGGSSQVAGEGGPAAVIPGGGEGADVAWLSQDYQRSPPLRAIAARLPPGAVWFCDGSHISEAVRAARAADVAIVFATQWAGEGVDLPDLVLPDGQDALIAAVAAANPRTVVVLETAGPVLMPWLERTAAVLEAWYPGAQGGEAIAGVLFGDTDPSGRLPVSFPTSTAQLPRPVLPGSDVVEPDAYGAGRPGQRLVADYGIEGADVGYRWYARTGQRPLFPFGFGLSYAAFAETGFRMAAGAGIAARVDVRNGGGRAGAEVLQLYAVSRPAGPTCRLAAFAKVSLGAGGSATAVLRVDPRLIADWDSGRWHIAGGRYGFSLKTSASDGGKVATIELQEQWLPP